MSRFVCVLAMAVACGGDQVPAENEASVAAEAPAADHTRGVMLQIDGMMCQGCADAATDALQGVAGVVDADVSFESGTARVTCDPTRVDERRLIEVLSSVEMGGERMPFEVSVIE